ncbi:11474_t:CDS:2, partial [Entrophospora sp. SA101]
MEIQYILNNEPSTVTYFVLEKEPEEDIFTNGSSIVAKILNIRKSHEAYSDSKHLHKVSNIMRLDNAYENINTNTANQLITQITSNDSGQTVRRRMTRIDEFLKNPFIFVDNTGKCKELSEIEYAMTMTAPIMKSIFSDVLDRLKLHWGETMSYVMSDCCRKIDLRFVHKAKGLELSHSECAKVPTPAKAVHDRSKFLQTLKGVLDNLLKEDLSDDEVQNSKILGN